MYDQLDMLHNTQKNCCQQPRKLETRFFTTVQYHWPISSEASLTFRYKSGMRHVRASDSLSPCAGMPHRETHKPTDVQTMSLQLFTIFLQFSISRYRLVVSIAPFVAPPGPVGSPKSCVRSSRPPPIPMPCCSTWSIPAAIFPN